MDLNTRSYEKFKEIYLSPEFKSVLKKAKHIKEQQKKHILLNLVVFFLSFIVCSLLIMGIWGASFITLAISALFTMIIGMILSSMFIKIKEHIDYESFYYTQIPNLIANKINIDIATEAVDTRFLYDTTSTEEFSRKSNWDKFKAGIKLALEHEQKISKKKSSMVLTMRNNFIQSGLGEKYDCDVIEVCPIFTAAHKDNGAKGLMYGVQVKSEHNKEYRDEDGNIRTQTLYKNETAGLIISILNMKNLNLHDCKIILYEDKSLLSLLTEATLEAVTTDNERMSFNRTELNETFDCYVRNTGKNQNANSDNKVAAKMILTPVIEDLILYIRRKYGKFNMAISNERVDFQFLLKNNLKLENTRVFSTWIKPIYLNDNDLKLSKLYKFYEILELQKLILKFFKCNERVDQITDQDIEELRLSVKFNKVSDRHIDSQVETYFKNICKNCDKY